ncbi:MAG: hypothetical protein R2688_00370 [Fimbriimonadaceae bacterium]
MSSRMGCTTNISIKAGARKSLKKLAYWHLKFKKVVANASGVLWTNQGELKESAACYRVCPNNQVIRYGTEIPQFDSAEATQAFADYAPHLVGKKFVMFLGRIDPIKNLMSLVEGFAQAFPEGSETQLLLAGPT